MMIKTDTKQWISASASCRLADIPLSILHRLVASGRVRTLAEPGATVKYRRTDLEALLVEHDTASMPSGSQEAPQ